MEQQEGSGQEEERPKMMVCQRGRHGVDAGEAEQKIGIMEDAVHSSPYLSGFHWALLKTAASALATARPDRRLAI